MDKLQITINEKTVPILSGQQLIITNWNWYLLKASYTRSGLKWRQVDFRPIKICIQQWDVIRNRNKQKQTNIRTTRMTSSKLQKVKSLIKYCILRKEELQTSSDPTSLKNKISGKKVCYWPLTKRLRNKRKNKQKFYYSKFLYF